MTSINSFFTFISSITRDMITKLVEHLPDIFMACVVSLILYMIYVIVFDDNHFY